MFRLSHQFQFSAGDSVQLCRCCRLHDGSVQIVLLTIRAHLLLVRLAAKRPIYVQQIFSGFTDINAIYIDTVRILFTTASGALFSVCIRNGRACEARGYWLGEPLTSVTCCSSAGVSLAVVGTGDARVLLISLEDGARLAATSVPVDSEVTGVHVLSDNSWVFVTCEDGSCWRWLLSPNCGASFSKPSPPAPLQSAPSSPAHLLRSGLSNLRQYSRNKWDYLHQRLSDSRDSLADTSPSRPPESVAGIIGDVPVWPISSNTLLSYYAPLNTLTLYDSTLSKPRSVLPLPRLSRLSNRLVSYTDQLTFLLDECNSNLLLLASGPAADSNVFSDRLLVQKLTLPAKCRVVTVCEGVSWPEGSGVATCVLVCSDGVWTCQPADSGLVSALPEANTVRETAALLKRASWLQNVFGGGSWLLEAVMDHLLRRRQVAAAVAGLRQLRLSPAALAARLAAADRAAILVHYLSVLRRQSRAAVLVQADKSGVLQTEQLVAASVFASCCMLLVSDGGSTASLCRLLSDARCCDWPRTVAVCVDVAEVMHSESLRTCVGQIVKRHDQYSTLLALCADDTKNQLHTWLPYLLCPALRSHLMVMPSAALHLMSYCHQNLRRFSTEQLRLVAKMTDPLTPELLPYTHDLLCGAECDVSSASTELTPENLVLFHLAALAEQLCRSSADVAWSEEDRSCLSTSVRCDIEPVSGTCSLAACENVVVVCHRYSVYRCHLPALSLSLSSDAEGGSVELVHVPTDRWRVCSVACGRRHVLLLTDSGCVLALGSNENGQLGVSGGSSERPRVVRRLWRYRVIAVAAGHHHSLAVDATGGVWAWGWNVYGQCAAAATTDVTRARLVPVLREAVSACAGYAHSAVLTARGCVFVFGCDAYGQLGSGTAAVKCVQPRQLQLSEPVIRLRCGPFSCLLECEGAVWLTGCDPQSVRVLGQQEKYSQEKSSLSDSHYRSHLVPRQLPLPRSSKWIDLGSRHVACLNRQLSVSIFAPETSTHCLKEFQDNQVDNMVCGADSVVVSNTAGQLFVWRMKRQGQLLDTPCLSLQLPPLKQSGIEPQCSLVPHFWCNRHFSLGTRLLYTAISFSVSESHLLLLCRTIAARGHYSLALHVYLRVAIARDSGLDEQVAVQAALALLRSDKDNSSQRVQQLQSCLAEVWLSLHLNKDSLATVCSRIAENV